MNEKLQKKIDRAIKLIQSAGKISKEHGQPLEVAYSGGKDSDVILELTRMAGVEYRAIYRNTTIDPPGTIRHALDRGAEMVLPKKTFFDLVERKGLPSRFRRFCCSELKEFKILDYCVLGVRKDESRARNERYKEPEICRVYNKKEKVRQYFPILDWTLADVTEFIQQRGIKCALVYYDDNGVFHPERRLGCMACPLGSINHRKEEFRKYPNMLKQYARRGGQWLDNQKIKNGKTPKLFSNIYKMIYFQLFCDNMADFRFKTGKTLFSDGLDCKAYLEEYFNVKF